MSKYCIGIDLGGTFIKFGLLSEDMQPGRTFQLPTPLEKGPESLLEQMAIGARGVMELNKLAREDILAVGIGSPGPISISRGVVIEAPNIPGMRDFPLPARLSRALSLPAVLENDANAAAYGEFLCGAGKGSKDMVLLTLGTGVGSGIIVGGRLLYGSHEIGGELGHIILVPGGELCGCGQRGCLERYCSATFMALLATRMIRDGRDSSLKSLLESKGMIDTRDIKAAGKAGDPLAEEVWDRGMYYLALGCVNICRIFDPERIVFSGGLTMAGEDLMAPLTKHFAQLHWTLTPIRTELRIAELGNDAGVIGAAGVAWRAFRQ